MAVTEAEREIIMLGHSPNGHYGQSWARHEPCASSLSQFSMGTEPLQLRPSATSLSGALARNSIESGTVKT